MNAGIVLPLHRTHSQATGIVKNAIWLYFWLLLFEGGLRRWIFPELATPLLLIREPVAIFILISAWYYNRFPANGYVVGMLVTGIMSMFAATFLGHGNLIIALFGARILVIHFPLMFVIGDYFNESDVLKIGRAFIWLAIPMTVLIAFQFYSPQSAWVNRGLGGDMEGAGFSGAMGFFRPPATFSFITGTAAFFSLVACFVCYFWLNTQKINLLLLTGASLALIAAIPLSISRTLFYQVGLTIAFACFAVSRNPQFLVRFVMALLGVVLFISVLAQTPVFQTSLEAFTMRFTTATEIEGGISGTLVDRFMGGMFGAITGDDELPIFGHGLGMGTNVGAKLLTGKRTFLIAEDEWGRLIGEMGLVLGLITIGIRVLVVARMALVSNRLVQLGQILPWLLLSVGGIFILQGQWAQPSNLGFSTLIGGLLIASLRK